MDKQQKVGSLCEVRRKATQNSHSQSPLLAFFLLLAQLGAVRATDGPWKLGITIISDETGDPGLHREDHDSTV